MSETIMNDNYDIKKLRKKKKRVNSRTKGSAFERKIAGLFNDSLGTTEFSRSPGSGAFATTHSLPEHLKIYGDLITPQNFKYCIECKKGYNKIHINNLLDYNSELWGFVKQCEKDSIACGREPLIIFQQDRQPILAILQTDININNKIEINNYKIYLFNEVLNSLDYYSWFTQEVD
jgi:hypothetical protein